MAAVITAEVSTPWLQQAGLKIRSWHGTGMNTFNAWRQHRDQEALEKALARIIETANGHQAKGLPKGSPAYFALRDKATAKIDTFCKKWNVDRTVIEAEAPALREMYALTIPDKQAPASLKLLAAFLGGILSLVLIGAASGLVNVGHNWVMHLFTHVIH
jgi:hypothetical protein